MPVKARVSDCGASAKRPYPKLITDTGGNVYYAYTKYIAACIYLNGGTPVNPTCFYSGNGFNFESPSYRDYEGSVTLSNI